MGEGLAQLAFLVGSPNRLRILESLTTGPRDRQDLCETAEVSRATVKRVLDGLDERGWVERDGASYRATPLGELVVEEVSSTLRTLDRAATLREISPWLPTDEFDFDLRRFENATITVPTGEDPLVILRRAHASLETATDLRLLSNMVVPDGLESLRRATVERGQRQRSVITTGVLDVIRNDETMAANFRASLSLETVEVRRYDGEIPCTIALMDETLMLGVLDDNGGVHGLIETDDVVVYEWAESIFTAHWYEAQPLDPETLT